MIWANTGELRTEAQPSEVNPYIPTSLAFGAWACTRDEFDRRGYDAALSVAQNYDRNLGLNLVEQLRTWKRKAGGA